MEISIALLLLSALAAIAIFLVLVAIYHAVSNPAMPAAANSPVILGEAQATVISPSESHTYLYATGREVFFPPAPHGAPVYEITFTGVLQQEGTARLSDAFYMTDSIGNFSYGTKWLRVNGHDLRDFEMVASDRCEHRYTIRIDGRGERLTLALDPAQRWMGALNTQVRLLPEGTPGIAAQRRREEVRRQVECKAAKVAERFSDLIQQLTIRAELFRNWGDPVFREHFAQAHGTELMRSQTEIREEANQLLGQHEILAYLRRHNPVVVDRLLGRLETLLIAERIAVEPKEKPQPLPPPRPRLTIEEVRERMCRRIEVQGGDRRALMAAILTEKQEQIDMLDTFSLSDDEREQQVREIEDWAASQLMKLNEGKEASNANYQTIS